MLDLEDYKIALGIDVTDTSSDDLINSFKDEIESKVKQTLGRDLNSQEYVETLSGNNEFEIVPSQFPITSISKLEVYQGLNTDNTEDWDEYSQGSEYQRLFTDNLQTKVIMDGVCFPKGTNNIRLTYTAGYTQIPYQILSVCKRLMILYYSEMKEGRLGISSKTRNSGQSNEVVSYDLSAEKKLLSELNSFKALNV